MDNNSNMLQLCRLCLVKDDVNIPIFEEQGDIRQIFLKISSCLPVKVSRDDQLPKKICDGCSYKLDMLYEFWNTSANAEKQLLTWLGEAGMTSQMTDGTISAVAQQIKPADAFVKQETIDPPDIHMDDDEEEDKDYMKVEEVNNVEEPPPKRARRTAAVKAAIAIDQNSDDDDDSGEPMTKVEDDSEDSDNEDHEPAFVDVPSTSADDQPGPSGVSKDGVEAPEPEVNSEKNLDTDDNVSMYIVEPPTLEIPLKCHICQIVFTNNLKFALHSYEHDVNRIFTCHICNFQSTEKYRFELHVRAHDNIKKFKCPVCNSQFSTLRSAVHHKNIHVTFSSNLTDEELAPYKVYPNKLLMPLICTTCKEIFTNMLDFALHSKIHDASGVYHCYICDLLETNTTKFERHILAHSGLKLYKCPTCAKQFNLLSQALDHERRHNREIHSRDKLLINPEPYMVKPVELEQPIKCDICQFSFTNNLDYVFHTKIHNSHRMYKCHICGHQQSSKYFMERHVRDHECTKKYKCPVCNKYFDMLRDAYDHKGVVHDGINPYECTECGKKFIQKKYLYHHLLNTHDERKLKSFECKYCNKKCKSSYGYESHMYRDHKDVNPREGAACNDCGKDFHSVTALKKHSLTVHSTHFPFKCKYCPKKFSMRGYPNAHQVVHSKEKKFSCTYCGKKFGFHSAYAYHMKLHTGEKPYSCTLCDRKFVSSGNRNLHLKNCVKVKSKKPS